MCINCVAIVNKVAQKETLFLPALPVCSWRMQAGGLVALGSFPDPLHPLDQVPNQIQRNHPLKCLGLQMFRPPEITVVSSFLIIVIVIPGAFHHWTTCFGLHAAPPQCVCQRLPPCTGCQVPLTTP